MKKFVAIALGVAAAPMAFGQTFSDDFESYNAGDYIAASSAAWATWSGATGGAEDVQITTAQAANGSNSIYLSTTNDTGGPQDIVLDFGGVYNTGQFSYENNFYVEGNKGAYFNFQAESTIGSVWAMDCYMLQTGELILSSGGTTLLETNYPSDTWFNARFEINLNTNTWELFIDNVSQGQWANPENRVASLNLYPVNPSGSGGNSTAGYYVDDVEYTITPYTLPTLNGAPIFIDNVVGLATQDKYPSVTVRNLGTSNITSFDLVVDYNGSQVTENVTGVNIPSLGTYDVALTNAVTLIAGSNPISATISNVNGAGADDDPTDDMKTISVNPVVPAAGKIVVAEEATGTWCGWCPRGAVAMDYMAASYEGFFAGIAVHNNDPMTVTEYDNGMGTLIGGYPSALVDRQGDIDPLAIESEFLQRITEAPTATIENGATWDATSRTLTVSLTTTFDQTATGNWGLACVLTENDVTGTGSGWEQSNYYSGGGNGVMGGYETLPNPVPANQMVYNEVARVLSPSFTGYPLTSTAANDVTTLNFTFVLPADWDENEIHIVGILVDNNGLVDNGSITTIADAVNNGLESGVDVTSVTTFDAPDAEVNVYPNPSNGTAFIDLQMDEVQEVNLRIRNITGQIVAERNYGDLTGANTLPVNTENFARGIYTIELHIGEGVYTQKLIVE